jgi:hypothetical protein
MSKSVFRGVKISGVPGAVPAARVDTFKDHQFCPEPDRKQIIALTRVPSYQKASTHSCASDVCQAAAETVLAGIDRSLGEIDTIVFANMRRDYPVPSTDASRTLEPQSDGGVSSDDDYFMNDEIAKKLKFRPEKMSIVFGSTTGTNGQHRALMCGFGVGLSWGVVSARLDGVYAPPVVEVA